MSTLNFETPLRLNLDPNQNYFLPHVLKLFFRKSPRTHNNVAPKLNTGGQKFRGGGGLLKTPPPDRIGLIKEIHCTHIVYNKIQLFPYAICYYNSCHCLPMHSYHHSNII